MKLQVVVGWPHRSSRFWPRILTVALLVFTFISASTRAIQAAGDLSGLIKSGDKPISGASVFIYTAGPRIGPGDI